MIITDSPINPEFSTGGVGGFDVTRNALTVAGCAVGAGTVVAGAAVVTAALPAQVLGAAALTGGLLYAGQRQADGKPIIPGMGDSDESAPATDAPAAA